METSTRTFLPSVDGEIIVIDEVTIPVSIGDRIERKLASGQMEGLKVTDVHLQKGLGGSRRRRGIPDFYEIEYEREGVQKHPIPPGYRQCQCKG